MIGLEQKPIASASSLGTSFLAAGFAPLLKAFVWWGRLFARPGKVVLLATAVIALGLLRTTQLPVVYVGVAALALITLCFFAADKGNSRTWAIYIFAFMLFAQLRTFADETGIAASFTYPIGFDKVMFLGNLPTVWLQEHVYNFGQVNALDIYATIIYLSYFFAPHLVVIAVWRFRPELFRRIAFAIVVTYYIGLAGALILPTAPPWLAAQQGDLPTVYRVVKDLAALVQPGSYDRGYEVAGSNPVAAMPSLHMAITVVVAFAAWQFGRVGKVVGIAYALSMAFALVYLGEHYVIDELAGLAAATVAWRLASRGLRLSSSLHSRAASSDGLGP